jgi:hypothetical protein
MTNLGMEPIGGTGEQLVGQMRAEMRTTGKLIKDMGLKSD